MSNFIETVEQQTLTVQEDVVTVISEGIQGPPGPRGFKGDPGSSGAVSIEAVSAAALGGHRIVILDDTGKVNYASNDTAAHSGRAIGMTLNSSDAGTLTFVQNFGEIIEPSWNWTVGMPIFLGTNGVMTQAAPQAPVAKFLMVVGFPISSNSMFLSLREPISIS